MDSIEKILFKIEDAFYLNALKMSKPVIENDLGALLYFATKYTYSKEEKYKVIARELLDNFIDVFSSYEFQTGILEGFDGTGYVLAYIKKCGIIDTEELLDDIESLLLQSLRLNINDLNFDLLYGSIGKVQYLLDSGRFNVFAELINSLIEKLYNCREEIDGRIFWYELESRNINLGLAHGLPGIFVFLTRLKALEFKNEYIDILLNGIFNSFLFFENTIPSISSFGAGFPLSKELTCHSRLAWCYGDLGIAYAILYYGKISGNKLVLEKYYNMLSLILQRSISESGLVHFSDYSFFDTGFCHGLSGIYYILYKLNEMENNESLQYKIEYWQTELLRNIEIQLSIEGDILFPKERQNSQEIYTIDKETMLNGVWGVGLVLLTARYKIADWSNFFLLY
ncbi:hypothetical protein HYN56_19785 [Flavobacterium crocinum]|uniref:Lanthionine synthetase n=1 Tax=Flavobacterium crocinum TaxID=2183896 RepID=A0A2S1YQI8_9FLAO|nr:lanthionine synthetase LanC family protein [Flavobacterium crocinum]AWK06345.1 hypothetical protein HYN56_19785 [Flavobacterium crocinum]